MVADGHDLTSVSDTVLAMYADNYFDYDDQHRVIVEFVNGTSRTSNFEYVQSGVTAGANLWSTCAIEIRPDGTQKIVYTNAAGA